MLTTLHAAPPDARPPALAVPRRAARPPAPAARGGHPGGPPPEACSAAGGQPARHGRARRPRAGEMHGPQPEGGRRGHVLPPGPNQNSPVASRPPSAHPPALASPPPFPPL